MARTLVGILEILLKQNVDKEAKKATTGIRQIENAVKRLNSSPWGSKFQNQLDKLKLSPAQAAAVVGSYDRLARNINGKIRKADLASWKLGTLSHLSQVRASLNSTAVQAGKMHAQIRGGGIIKGAGKTALVAFGAYTGWYAAGVALRAGFTGASKGERQTFREEMAGLNGDQRSQLAAVSMGLSSDLRAVSATEVRELGLRALGTMGSLDRVIQILPTLVDALVVLKSTKGAAAGPGELGQLMRGIDVLGQNEGGQLGIDQINQIIEGVVRASQIEGQDLDVGKMWSFARRAKIASSALSTEFIATVVPAIMQDMGPDTAGNAISSAYQSLVIGANSTASKKNLEEQKRLGIRSGPGKGSLIGDELFGLNPYQWVKEYLVPALKADGIDMDSDVEVQKAIAKLARNTNATALLSRMVLQQDQIDKNVELYKTTMGREAAKQASSRDPFLAYEGFKNSLENLSVSISSHMNIIVPSLNWFTDAINSMGSALTDASGWEATAMGLGAGAAGYGVFKGGKYLLKNSLFSAGPALNVAAVELQAAAAMLGGAGMVGGKGGKLGKLAAGGVALGKKLGPVLKIGGKFVGPVGAGIMVYNVVKPGPKYTPSELTSRSNPDRYVDEIMKLAGGSALYQGLPFTKEGTGADSSEIKELNQDLSFADKKLSDLNKTISPQVDSSGLDGYVEKLKGALSLHNQLTGGFGGGGFGSMNNSFADFGVSP